MTDEEKNAAMANASRLEVAISAAHSGGMNEVQLKPFIDLVNEWKTGAGVSAPFVMQPSDAQMAADAAKALADKNAEDARIAADKKAAADQKAFDASMADDKAKADARVAKDKLDKS